MPTQQPNPKPNNQPEQQERGGAPGARTRRVAEQDRSTKTLGLKLLQEVKEVEDEDGEMLARIFLELPDRKEYPDYYEMISQPICLNDIEAALKKDDEFRTLEDVHDAILEVCANCHKFNERGSDIYSAASQIKKFTQKKFRFLLHCFEEEATVVQQQPDSAPGRVLNRPVAQKRGFTDFEWLSSLDENHSPLQLDADPDASKIKKQKTTQRGSKASTSSSTQPGSSTVGKQSTLVLERKLANQQQQIDSLKKELVVSREDSAASEESEREARQLEIELDSAKKKIESLEKDKNQLSQKNTTLAADLTESQKETQEATSNCLETKKVNETLGRELAGATEKVRLLGEDKKAMKSWFDERLQDATATTRADEAQLATLQLQYRQLQANHQAFLANGSPQALQHLQQQVYVMLRYYKEVYWALEDLALVAGPAEVELVAKAKRSLQSMELLRDKMRAT